MRRRGIHAVLSSSMLIGLAVALSGALLAALGGHVHEGAGCAVSGASLHGTGPGTAYLGAVVRNTGSASMASAEVSFVDGAGVRHAVGSPPLRLGPGGSWDASGAVPARVADARDVAVAASASFHGGSAVLCEPALARAVP